MPRLSAITNLADHRQRVLIATSDIYAALRYAINPWLTFTKTWGLNWLGFADFLEL